MMEVFRFRRWNVRQNKVVTHESMATFETIIWTYGVPIDGSRLEVADHLVDADGYFSSRSSKTDDREVPVGET